MTSSPERKGDPTARKGDDLPPALRSMWRLCKLGYRHEPQLMLAAFVLSQLEPIRKTTRVFRAEVLRVVEKSSGG